MEIQKQAVEFEGALELPRDEEGSSRLREFVKVRRYIDLRNANFHVYLQLVTLIASGPEVTEVIKSSWLP
jgi:hypothetical protein